MLAFFADRLKVQQREAGRSPRSDRRRVRARRRGRSRPLLARVHALQAFVATEDGANLLAGYKRAANILKKEGWTGAPRDIARSASEQGIAQTGEEDPLAMVEDPAFAEAVAALDARMAHRRPPTRRSRPRRRWSPRSIAPSRPPRRDRSRGFRRGDGGAGRLARADRCLFRCGDGQRSPIRPSAPRGSICSRASVRRSTASPISRRLRAEFCRRPNPTLGVRSEKPRWREGI